MFTDFWRDIIALVGLLLTMAGLVYAIVQIRRTRSAAQAAEAAAKETLAESRLGFQQYVAASAHRFFSDTQGHIDRQEWEKAVVRINDVADQAAQMASLDPEWQRFAELLRLWAATCRRMASGERKRFDRGKWVTFSVELQTKIDSCHGPFRRAAQEASDDSTRQIP